MKVLLIFNHEPYDNTDVTWNGLRLAETLRKKGQEVRIFLMNGSYFINPLITSQIALYFFRLIATNSLLAAFYSYQKV